MKPKKETKEDQIKRYFSSLQNVLSSDFVWQSFSDEDINSRFCDFLSTMRQAVIDEMDEVHSIYVDLKNGIK